MEFPVRLVLAASSAAHRINDGFVKKYDDSKKESNSALLYKHFFQGHDLKVEDQDYEMADEIIDYLKGLGIKAMERDLTDFQRNVLKFVTSASAGKDKIGIAASLPKVFLNKVESDSWEDRERELGRTSEFVGILNQRNTFDNATIEYVRYIPKTMSNLVTASVDGKHIIKFFLNDAKDIKVQSGKKVKLVGFVKAQTVSKWTGFKETMINRIKFESVGSTTENSK